LVAGLFGKAKRKLLGKELESGGLNYDASVTTVSGDASSAAAVGGIDPALWEPQELGQIPDVAAELCYVRSWWRGVVVKCLIRSVKLLYTGPG